MASTNVSYIGDGSTTLFTIGFPYLSPSHVVVTLDGVATTAFTFPTSASLQFTVAPTAGQAIYIHRVTPQTPLVDFVDGSTLTEALLDTATNQAIYIAQEAFDGVSTSQSLSDAVTAAVIGGNLATSKAADAAASQLAAAISAVKAQNSALDAASYAGGMVAATQAEAEAGVEDTHYTTSLKVKQAITVNALSKASQIEAEAGVENTKYTTSLRVKQAVTAALASFSSGGFSNIQVFTTSGTFTAPTGVTKIKVTVIGGGGNGGTGIYTGAAGVGGSGAGGGFAMRIFTITALSSHAVIVGAAAGTSSFGSFVSATGGGNGATGSGDTGGSGSGGTGTNGDINIRGSNGHCTQPTARTGGCCWGGIASIHPSLTNGAGIAGVSYGSGGTGGFAQILGQVCSGGAGGAGLVIVEY